MKIYRYSMRSYEISVPGLDQSDCSICYNCDLMDILSCEIMGIKE